jgi:ArsR family transcriptional regulator, arsenate/arsenite/antimonite-responsive transcriptional repressor
MIEWSNNNMMKGTERMELNDSTASYLKALGHPTRLQMARELVSGELSVSEVEERVKIQQANASQHLKILKINGIVDSKRQGTTKYFFLREPGKIVSIIEIIEKENR